MSGQSMKTLLLLLAVGGLSGCAVYPAPANDAYQVYGPGAGPPYVVEQPVNPAYIYGGVYGYGGYGYAYPYGYPYPYVYPRGYNHIYPGAFPRRSPYAGQWGGSRPGSRRRH